MKERVVGSSKSMEHYDGNDYKDIDFSPLVDAELCGLATNSTAIDNCESARQAFGTKWGTYHTKVHNLGGDGSPVLIEFECAWGPPNMRTMRAIDAYLCNTYMLKNIVWAGHDPYDNSTEVFELSVKETENE